MIGFVCLFTKCNSVRVQTCRQNDVSSLSRRVQYTLIEHSDTLLKQSDYRAVWVILTNNSGKSNVKNYLILGPGWQKGSKIVDHLVS